ncbi:MULTISPECIES: TauD/TfdA family dioxygenase [Micromonospora]|uniref:TauD/TfdA family dioxygenase n=1 Tax=Micromonospora TaxID=1873 RepID=UPI001EE7DB83|nr:MULTISPECIES: TauD/TfdA family dioxygenase [Micromonospora]MCG5451796.1 TauD/TfdA family dioxygenase [Micromonospora hortensis]MCX5118698.1 TauD/TfdA family dioxygenase [Micromonospora sp. NBC_00362]WTI09154.1 TauD/TfdA family dioxygenase [Micromonospora sp. NBC_00821]
MDHVKESCLFPERNRVACIEATSPGISPAGWATEHLDLINDRLDSHGAVLLRGFDAPDAPAFSAFVKVFGEEMAEYTYRSTPRSKVGDVYTSTEYPASEVIPLHNEMAYTSVWPRRLFFYSNIPAQTGGETPLADSHAVWQRIPAEVRERFERHGVRYVRNYRVGLGVSWQETFPGMDREAVQEFCRERGITYEWFDDGALRTTETCQAVTVHPVSGRTVWMNQAHLFHVSNLPEATREALLELLAEEDLPRNAYLGDGSPITDADLAAIRAAFDAESLAFPWQQGDLLVVDNMAMAHGRSSFTGSRKTLVAMTGSYGSREGA